MKIKINNKTIIMIILFSCILFYLPLFKFSYAIKNENNKDEFNYIFDPSQYIEYKGEKEETITNDNLNNQANENKRSESQINKIKEIKITKKSNTIANNIIEKPNYNINSTNYNFIAVGDWYCNEETKRTINNILEQYPELIITTGDQVKESPSASCWIEMSEPIKDKMKIAIGNHD
ncbi:MAG TPA: metallophosphoesterase, partial [Nitrososphaeraceae archaeon]|nr:metallophosphoesterase [Nitrososphaeraceae archaeon]